MKKSFFKIRFLWLCIVSSIGGDIAYGMDYYERVKKSIRVAAHTVDQWGCKIISECSDSKVWDHFCHKLLTLGKIFHSCPSYRPATCASIFPRTLSLSTREACWALAFIIMTSLSLGIVGVYAHHPELSLFVNTHDVFSPDTYDLCHFKPDETIQCCTLWDNTFISCCRLDQDKKLSACDDIHLDLWRDIEIEEHYVESSRVTDWCQDYDYEEVKRSIDFEKSFDRTSRTAQPHNITFFGVTYDKDEDQYFVDYQIKNGIPHLEKIFNHMAKIFNIPSPRLCIIRTDKTWAWAYGGKNAICLSEGLLKIDHGCPLLIGIIGHEMGHLNLYHNVDKYTYVSELEEADLPPEIVSRYNIETTADIYAFLVSENAELLIRGLAQKYDSYDSHNEQDKFYDYCRVQNIGDHPHAFLCRIPFIKRVSNSYKSLDALLAKRIASLRTES